MADLEALLQAEAGNVALVLGNGINRFGAPGVNSWDALLMQIAADCGVRWRQFPTAPPSPNSTTC